MLDLQLVVLFRFSSFHKYRKYKRLFKISVILFVLFLVTSIILGAFLIDIVLKRKPEPVADHIKSDESEICISRACIKSGNLWFTTSSHATY